MPYLKRSQAWLRGLLLGLTLLLGFLASPLAPAQTTDFDHASTGFVLSAQHQYARCESCHLKGVFKGTPKDCVACHGWNNPRAATVMPTNHIPTANLGCEVCHAASQSQFVDATRTFSHALVSSISCQSCHSSANPHPNVKTNPTNPTHLAILNNGTSCGNCHNSTQFTGPKVPANHIPTANVVCSSCHTTTNYSVMPSMRAIHAFAPSSSSNCQQCHSTAAAAIYRALVPGLVSPPSNHIAMNGQSCEVCHVGASSSVQLPVQDGAQFANSSFSHSGITSGCASCHGPTVNIGSFFGIGSMVRMPPSTGPGANSHIPGFTTCETCHAANMPSGQMPVNAVLPATGTGFMTPPPTPAMIHAGVSGNCSSCHETGYLWLGVDQYNSRKAPPYTGFQTRPNGAGSTYAIADAAHPGAGDCSNCHSVSAGFVATAMPGNHIPVSGSATCVSCHKSGNFSALPAISDIHANAPSSSTNCAQCHSAVNAALYRTATMTIVAPPAGHIADLGNVGCEGCHVGANGSLSLPVADNAKFSNGGFTHSGITSGCVSCHGPSIGANSFYGISSIVVMPPSAGPGAASHLPTTSTCESCHTVTPSGQIAGNASTTGPGTTGFYTLYTPTAAQIHAGARGGCASCHDSNYVWRGMDLYPITFPPGSASYRGFHTRPQIASSGTFFVQDAAHPVTGECSNCHSSQIDFNVSVAPTNHIPIGGTACSACHRSADFSIMPSLGDIHAPASSAVCADCHSTLNAARYNAMASMRPAIVAPPGNHIDQGGLGCDSCHVGAGSSIAALPVQDGAKFSGSLFSHGSITTGCTNCHGPSVTPASFFGVLPKTISSLSPIHLPVAVNAACETCHVGQVPSTLVPSAGMTTFAGTQFSHSGITTGCVNCHGPSVNANSFFGSSPIAMPPTSPAGSSSHLPTSTTCENCHTTAPAAPMAAVAAHSTPGSDFRLNAPSSGAIHNGITGSCNSCHDTAMNWMGMDLYPINPATFTNSTAQYKGFQTRPQAAAGTFNVNNATHPGPGTGDCSNCHSGFASFSAPTMPGNHIPTAATCSNCHRSADFSVMPSVADIHANIASNSTGCANCHSEANAATYNSMPSMNPQIVSPPGDHIDMGSTGCESCHMGTGTSMAVGVIPNGAKFSGSLFNHAGATASCASCHGQLVGAGAFFGVTPKSMGSLTPAHVPVSNTTPCDTCHIAGAPTGLVPSAGMTTFAGAKFSHSGITTDCATCHGPTISATSFYGISKIIVMPPSAAPGPNSHIPSSTVCESCHAGATPAGLVAGVATANVPGSGFRSSPPSQSQIHAGISGSCATCHETPNVWLGMDLYPARQTAPYTGFQTRPQTTSGTYYVADAAHPRTGDCSNCHGNTSSEFTSPSKPSNHIPTAPTSACTSCHTNPDFSVMPTLADIHANAPSTSTGCDQCHSAANAATYAMPSMSPALVGVPLKHIDMGGQACEVCHVGANSSLRLPVQNGAKFSNSAFSHAGITSGCATCHGATVNSSTFYGITPKTINSLTPAHVPVSASMPCETCHTNAIPSTLIPLAGASGGMTTFAGAQFSHSGITSGCATCHGQGITGSSFYGISKIVVMPPSSVAGATSHLPTSTTCENCHLGSTPSTLVPGVATKTAPGSGFLAPAPTSNMIHAGATGTCTSCHETNMVWMSVGQYPITTTAPYKGFQTRPYATATTFSVADAAHPTTGNCSNCHASMADFTASALPSNHIPIKTGVSCTSCHTNVDFAVMPTIANIHVNAPSSSANCAQCHSATNAATYNTMASMNPKIVTVGSNHVDMAALGCESCHVSAGGVTSSMTLPVSNTAKFSNAAYSHTGVSAGCATCHGQTATIAFQGVTPKAMSGLTPVHVPTTLDCAVCHTTVPSALIPLSGGTGANTFAGGKFSHSGITSGCATCHGAGVGNSSFFGITRLVVLPATTATGGSNVHIPSPINAQCEVCHLGSTPAGLVPALAVNATLGSTLFKTPTPTGSMIHTGINSNCNSCHENGLTWLDVSLYPGSPTTVIPGSNYTGFQTRPVAGGVLPSIADPAHPPKGDRDCSACHGSTSVFNVTAKPANHIPVNPGSACTTCHTNITATNRDFSVAPTVTAIHANAPVPVTNNCAACHSVTNAAQYAIPSANFSIKAPDAKHIPFGTTPCETCHVGTGSSMTTGVVVTGNHFSGSLYSHSGVTTGCVTCHGPTITGTSFTGVTSIVVAPKTSPQGLTSHIPYTAACELCHAASTPAGLVTVTGSKPVPGSGFKLPKPSGAMIHANSSSFACMTCHEANYRWMGVDQYPISPTVVTAGASYTGFQTRPVAAATTFSVADSAHTVGGLATGDCSLCHVGTTAFTAAGKPAGHMPTTAGAACSTCHGADFSIATLSSLTALHTGITGGLQTYTATTITTKSCTTCHVAGTGGTSGTAPFTGCATQAACSSPPPLNAYQPMIKTAKGTHVPTGNTDCNGCHASFTAFSGMNMKPTIGTIPHNNAKFGGVLCKDCHERGMSWFGVATLKTRPSGHSGSKAAPADCAGSNCHDLGGFRALQMPIMRQALVGTEMSRLRPNLPTMKPSRGTLGNSFDHKGVAVGQCKSCHDGKAASGMPARHLMVTQSCDTCHRTTTWTPAQFNHSGISPNTCLACHNGMGASGKPSGHFMSARSCDSCHKNLAWKPVNYQHLSPSYVPGPDMLNCISCHVTNGEIIPRQLRGLNRTKPIPVGP